MLALFAEGKVSQDGEGTQGDQAFDDVDKVR